MSGGSASAAPAEPAARPIIACLTVRVVLLGFGALALVAGLYGGLWRLGWAVPGAAAPAALHGPLLICGLFGTLISLERAVAMGKAWPYAAPVLSAFGAATLIVQSPPLIGTTCFAIAAFVLALACLVVAVRHPAMFTATILLGALMLVAGDLSWLLGAAMPDVAALWLAFLVLTIAGERLELSRVLPPKAGSAAVFCLSLLLLVAGAFTGLASETGSRLFGAGLLSCAAWLLRHDIALRNIRLSGQTRFSAACMLPGYGWLAVAGMLLIVAPPATSAFGYDAALHAITIGFVLSMVFGHALIILPAIIRVRPAYHGAMYLPLALLHLSVVARVAGGVAESHVARLWSGPLTLLAMVSFAGCVLACAHAPGLRVQ